MARRKKEPTTSKKNKNATAQTRSSSKAEKAGTVRKKSAKAKNATTSNIYVPKKVTVEDDTGNSSLDEAAFEDTQILNAEDIQNIVVGDLKTVCVTKAASDDESEITSRQYTVASVQETSREIVNPSQPSKIECEHPKKKIVRLLNAGLCLDDPADIFVNGGDAKTNNTASPCSEGKNAPNERTSWQVDRCFTPANLKYNGEIPAICESSTDCDDKPSENDSLQSSRTKDCSKEDTLRCAKIPAVVAEGDQYKVDREVGNSLSEQTAEYENYHNTLHNQQSADDLVCEELEVASSNDQSIEYEEVGNCSFTVIDEYSETDQLSKDIAGMEAEQRSSSEYKNVEMMEDDLALWISEESVNRPSYCSSESAMKVSEPATASHSGENTNLTTTEEPLSEKLSAVTIACDSSESKTTTDKEQQSKSLTSACAKENLKITMFDFLSVERTNNSTKNVQNNTIIDSSSKSSNFSTTKSSSSAEPVQSVHKMGHNCEEDAIKNHVIHEKSKTDLVKPKKNEEKTKKLVKKESNNKQGKKSVDNNKSKEEKKEDSSSADKRRRSTRLKSKPEYEKYDEEMLQAAMKIAKEKVNNGDDCGKIENSEYKSVKLAVKDLGKASAKISVDPADMPVFQHMSENVYLTERTFSKDAERMICDCVLTREEICRGESGCGEDCLNRLLLIECCSRCTLGDRCTNKRFQKRAYAKCEVFKTNKKGNGLKVLEDIPSGTFIMEYVGEVIDSDEFERRAMEYAHNKIPHFYFMSLKSDCIIDATMKGNCSRFINHSCEPNAETQKWTVQGELRIGFFSKRDINAGEEITFDYQLQRYGKQAQRCYCETPSCSGWIGEDPDKQTDDDRPKERKKKKQRDQYLDLETALDDISQVGLINRHQTLSLNRLMVHAKELPVRMQILQLIEEGHPACRRLFVDYHGLPIIWSWMVDCAPEQEELQIQLLKTLMALPITNKTILVDSKVYSQVEQWAFVVEQKLRSEALSAQSVLESVEDIGTADETPVSEMAQKILNVWSSLREAYRIPKKERIQQMKEHEREADQNVVKPRLRRLPLYAEKMRDRYHRNRYNRDKDFDKIYYDRWKRKDSPDSRNHDHRDHHRKDYKDSGSSSSRISKLEHRYMFELKVREQEEKRKWEEEEQKYWLQQNPSMYYGAQPHQMMPGQYVVPSVPSTPFSADASVISHASASQLSSMLQSIQSISAAATPSHTYYANPSSYISPNIMLPQPQPTPQLASQSSTSTPAVFSQQVSPSPQAYYQNPAASLTYASSNTVSVPTPVSYPHQTLVDLANTNMTTHRAETSVDKTTCSSFDYQSMQSPSLGNEQQTSATYADNAVYASYNGTSLYTSTSSVAAATAEKSELQYSANYDATEESKAAAIANAAATDIKNIKLPPKWKVARDSEGRVYYYHKKTRISQWYPPACEEPPQTEEVEQTDEEESAEEGSSAAEEADVEDQQETKKRRRNYDDFESLSKRRHRETSEKETYEQNPFDMDPDLKENSAAMSSVFQYSDNEDYSPVIKEVEGQKSNEKPEEETQSSTPPPSNIPLITEHIISPREPIDKEERIRNKKRIRTLKEKYRRQKKGKRKILALDESLAAAAAAAASGSSNSNGGVNSISSSSNLLSVPADTSSNTDRKKKDVFRSNMANFVVHCLNPYFRSSCTTARITNYNDFKHLARKLTHFVMLKELKHCRNVTDLTCNSSVKHKAKEYIRKYMSKFGEVYVRPPDDNISY